MNVLTRAALPAAIVAAALAPTQPANAGIRRCASHYATPGSVHTDWFLDCTLNDVLTCVLLFQPTPPPLDENLVPHTLNLATCPA